MIEGPAFRCVAAGASGFLCDAAMHSDMPSSLPSPFAFQLCARRWAAAVDGIGGGPQHPDSRRAVAVALAAL